MSPHELVGIPYVNRGSSVDGVDCWGLVWLTLARCYGLQVPRYDAYEDAQSLTAARLIQAGWAEWLEIARGQEQPGDVLAFKDPKSKLPVHCGVVIGEGRFLHCMEGRETCTERYDIGVWNKLLVRIGRWKS
jgi:cell wall-associated NlpC family hydrolase